MSEIAVSEVKATEPGILAVLFADGLSGKVILKPSHLRGVFAELEDAEVFAAVHCENGFVEWPGNIDLAPDAMYDAIKDHGVWVLE